MWNGIDQSDPTVPPPAMAPLPPLTIDTSFGMNNLSLTNSNFLDTFKFDSNTFAPDNSGVFSTLARDEMERARIPPVNYFNPTINYNFYPQTPMMDSNGANFGSTFINTSMNATLPSFDSYSTGDRPPMGAYLSDLKLPAPNAGSEPRPGSGSGNLFSAIAYPGSTIGLKIEDQSRIPSPIADSGTGSLTWEDPGVDLYDGSGSAPGNGLSGTTGCGLDAGFGISGHSLFTTMTFNSITDYIPFAVAGAEPKRKRNNKKNPAALDVEHLQRNALKPVKPRAPRKSKKTTTNDEWLRQFLASTTTSIENVGDTEKMLETKKDGEIRVEHVEAAQKKKKEGTTNANGQSTASLRNKLKKQHALIPPPPTGNSSVKALLFISTNDLPPAPIGPHVYATKGFALARPNKFTPLRLLEKDVELPPAPLAVPHVLEKKIELPQTPFYEILSKTDELPWTVLVVLPRLRTAAVVSKRKTTVPKKMDALEKEIAREIKVNSNDDHENGDEEMPLLSPGMVEETLDGIDNDSIIDVERLSPIHSSSSSSSSYDDSADDYKPPVVKRRRRCHKKRAKVEKDVNNNKKTVETVEKPKKIQEPVKKTPNTNKKIKNEIDTGRSWDLIKVTDENRDYWLEPCEAEDACVIKTNVNWWYALGEHRVDAIGLEIVFDANF